MSSEQDSPWHGIQITLTRMEGEQRLTNQKIDTAISSMQKDTDQLQVQMHDLREALKGKVSIDRYTWLEKAGYAAFLAAIALVAKAIMGLG